MNKLRLQNMDSIKINSIIITLFVLTPLLSSETILLSSFNIHFNSVFFLIILNILFILYNKNDYKNLMLKQFNLHILQIMFFIILIIGSLLSEYPLLSLKRLILILYITFSLGSMLLVLRKELNIIIKNLIKVMSFIAILASIYYFLFLLLGVNVVENNTIIYQKIEMFNIQILQNIVGRRPSSIFLNPNSLGLYMYLNIMLIFFSSVQDKTLKITNIINIVIFTIVLIGSKSRASTISLIIFSLIFFLNYNSKYNISKSSYRKLNIGLIIILTFVLYYTFYSRIGKGSSGRFGMWIQAGNLVIKKPFFGIGFGLSTNTLFSGQLSTHNTYIKIAVEMGLINLSIYLHGIYTLVKKTIITFNNQLKRQEKYIGLYLVSFIISFTFYQLFESPVFVYNYTYNILIIMVTYSIIYIHDCANDII